VQPSPQDLQPSATADPDSPPTYIRGVRGWVRDYFLGDDPTFSVALVPLCFLSMLLFTRHPLKTNFIFDEQEALLANPYVRSIADPVSKVRWVDAFYRDFWGLPYDRSIGSYRPIPDLVWRALWGLGARDQTPFLHHWVNVLLHGVNGALMTVLVMKVTRSRPAAWLAGAVFVASAVLTEAVSGVVGIADVLGATGALLALLSLSLPLWGMPFGVFLATLFGLYSKESALCCVPLVPIAALFTAHITHPERPMRWLRASAAWIATTAAFVLYVEARRRMFPAPIAHDLSVEANADKPQALRIFAALLRWYAQPALPRDPLNNPLIDAPTPTLRIAAAMRVYARGLGQVLFPLRLSGDYSAPQEPVPDQPVFPESIIGAGAMVLPLLLAPCFAIAGWWRARKRPGEVEVLAVIGVALLWIVISYFPVSNIPVVLPTVRAERFWYFPVLGSSMILGILFAKIFGPASRSLPRALFAWALVTFFFVFQCIAARSHANDYTDDLSFWDATRKSVPRSAKAHLNYSVMQGARGNLEARLESNRTALELAPQWPMANVYLGDTLCRLQRPLEATPHYERGFELAPNDINLIALGLQCLWDQKAIVGETPTRKELEDVGAKHPGSWLDFLVKDIIENGEAHNGVDPKYRPRGYNEGPKSE
jgi:hypothetical protein